MLPIPDNLILLPIGLFAGMLAGLLGIGGGLVVLTLLQTAVITGAWPASAVPYGFAGLTGMSAMLSALAGSAAALTHWQGGRLLPTVAVPLAGMALLGSYTGGRLSGHLPEVVLLGLYALLVVAMLGVMWQKRSDDAHEPTSPIPSPNWLAPRSIGILVLSILVGLLSGLLGVGGAVFLIPLMTAGLNIPLRQAMGCGALIAACVGWAATAGKFQAGLIHLPSALTVGLAAMLGGWLGARWMPYWPASRLRWLLMGVMLWALTQAIAETWRML